MKTLALVVLGLSTAAPYTLPPDIARASGDGTTPQLCYYLMQNEPDQAQFLEEEVDLEVTLTVHVNGEVIEQDVWHYQTKVPYDQRASGANHLSDAARNAITAMAARTAGQAGWLAGLAAGDLVLGLVPIGGSYGTYATALGTAAVAPWVGGALFAGGAAL